MKHNSEGRNSIPGMRYECALLVQALLGVG